MKRLEGRLAVSGRVKGGWPERLRLAVSKYNRSWHSAIRMAPDQVTRDNAGLLTLRQRNRHHHHQLMRHSLSHHLRVGALVRIKEHSRGRFAKSNAPLNSKEIYVIGGIRLHPTGLKYKLFTTDEPNIPVAGSYYEFELVKVRVPQK